MTSKFDVERAVLVSELPSTERLLLLVLLTHADMQQAEIPAKFTPSLTGLSRESGLHRSAVKRVMSRLETSGWVMRLRPPVEQSRKGARTRYQLAVPVGAQNAYPVGAEDAQPGRTERLGVGAQGATPGRPGRPIINPTDTNPSNPRARDTETTAVINALELRTGKKITEDHAALVIKQLVDTRNGVRDRVAYLTGAIAKDPDPARFLPTPSPPPLDHWR